jgi:PAS domain S-box-containing protein
MFQRLIEGIYMPHGYCLLWEPWLVTLHAASDFLTFAAYSAIPLAIWMFVSKRPHVEMRGLARLFAAFILWCGLTHLFNIITLWYPVYELQGLVKGITAAVSVTTAVMIFPLIPKALAIPSPNELQLANAQLQQEIMAHRETLQDLQNARDELERRVVERTKDLEEATERFKALFEHAPVAMLMVDRDGTLKQANAAAESLFNCDRHALLGEPVESLLPAGLRSEHSTLSESYVRTPTAQPMAAGRELFAHRKDGHQFPVEIGLSPVPGEDQSTVIASVVDISGRRKEEQRIQFIMRELSHRSKNLLAVIQGMVRQALLSSPDMPSFERSFAERLQGLARSHDLLVGKNWEGTSISELVHAQMAILNTGDPSAISVNGPHVFLAPEAAQNLGLALHELATNAIKHGALSGRAGTISVSWHIDQPSGQSPRLILDWVEKGPILSAEPPRRGFGRTVLDRVVPASLEGSARLAFGQNDVSWTLDVPLSSLERRTREPAVAA